MSFTTDQKEAVDIEDAPGSPLSKTSSFLQQCRDKHDARFPNSQDQFKQGIWSLERRLPAHECSNPHLFTTMTEETSDESLELGILGKGDVTLYLPGNTPDSPCSKLQLTNVLYVFSQFNGSHHKFSTRVLGPTFLDIVTSVNGGPRLRLTYEDSLEPIGMVRFGPLYFPDERGQILDTCMKDLEHDERCGHIVPASLHWSVSVFQGLRSILLG